MGVALAVMVGSCAVVGLGSWMATSPHEMVRWYARLAKSAAIVDLPTPPFRLMTQTTTGPSDLAMPSLPLESL